MNRIKALREVSVFMRRYQTTFAALPRDTDGRPNSIEIRKLLAIDPEMMIALAAVLAVIYFSIENEAHAISTQGFEGRNG